MVYLYFRGTAIIRRNKGKFYIIIGSQEVIKLKNIVKAVDKNAFIAIYNVRDVFGKGCSILPECNYKCALK